MSNTYLPQIYGEKAINKAVKMVEDFMNEEGNIHIALALLKTELKRNQFKNSQVAANILLSIIYDSETEEYKFWKQVSKLLPIF